MYTLNDIPYVYIYMICMIYIYINRNHIYIYITYMYTDMSVESDCFISMSTRIRMCIVYKDFLIG